MSRHWLPIAILVALLFHLPFIATLNAEKLDVEEIHQARKTDEFWGGWDLLHAMFEKAHAGTYRRQNENSQDADMFAPQTIDFEKKTSLSRNEQTTLIGLWAIARLPYRFDKDSTTLDDFFLSLVSNPEVLQVNQSSENNGQISRKNNLIVWSADVPDSDDKYVALFNAQSEGQNFAFDVAEFKSPVIDKPGHSQEISISVKGAKRLVLFVHDAGDNYHHDHAVWVDPVLQGPKGAIKLSEMDWSYADSGWGKPRTNRTCDDKPLVVDGQEVQGIGTHANSRIVYELPPGFDTFTAKGVLTDKGSVVFAVLTDRSEIVEHSADVGVSLAQLGIFGKAKIRDLLAQKDLGLFDIEFSQELPFHGCGLYRVSPLKSTTTHNNPVIDGYYADPDILYCRQDKKFYIYPTSDGFDGWSGKSFKTFSSVDLVNWNDEGVILDLETDVSWANRNAWAPCIIEKKIGGEYRYYYYFTAAQKIGVAVASKPNGPFVDSGRALIDFKPPGVLGGQEIDPEVFHDPVSGKDYLYWGNGYVAVAELNSDMTSIKRESIKIITPPNYREGTTVFYRGNKYYFLWSDDDTRSENYRVHYGISDSPLGPIQIPSENLILSKIPKAGIYGTGHNSVLQKPGTDQWYMVYHRFGFPNSIKLGPAAGFHREVCIDEMHFDREGRIRKIAPTHTGVNLKATANVELP